MTMIFLLNKRTQQIIDNTLHKHFALGIENTLAYVRVSLMKRKLRTQSS